MNRISFQIKATNFPSPPAHPNVETDGLNLENKVSPSVLLIIIILAVIFFISGLLHLLVRVLLRPPIREQEDHLDNVTDLQGQLQQLFHLHDAGVDQSFIDTLPVFQYRTIIGLKNPFDCAVCLCEFELEDKLRLLPRCSHAFHMECIDTWLLSHSTCPLCRASLLLEYSPSNICSPMVLVLESGSDSSREIVNDREACNIGRTSSVLTTNSHLGYQGDNELGSSRYNFSARSGEVLAMEDNGGKVVPVKLGKFMNVDMGEGTSNNENADARRCYSMGSFEYVMDENSSLQVPIRTPMKKQSSKKPNLPLTPGHRPAMSECDCESRRGFNGFEAFKSKETIRSSAASLVTSNGRSKRESFSVSKVWLRGKNEKRNPSLEDSSRRALSFRFPVNCNATDDDFKVKINGNGGDEEENLPGMNSLACEAKTPSFARRTLLWLVGRPNKVVQSPPSSNS